MLLTFPIAEMEEIRQYHIRKQTSFNIEIDSASDRNIVKRSNPSDGLDRLRAFVAPSAGYILYIWLAYQSFTSK